MISNFFSRHAFAIVLAVIAGVFTGAPQLIAEHNLGDRYLGIHKEITDDETYYVTRAQEIIDGHPTLGNPYLYEEKNQPPLQAWYPDAVLAWGSTLFADMRTGDLVWDFLLPALILLLTYVVFFFITGSYFLSAAGAGYLSIGLYLSMFHRSPSPQFDFIFFLLFFISILNVLRTPSRRALAFAIIAFALLFYIYTYYWTYAVILLGLLVCASFVFFRIERMYLRFIAILTGGFVLAIPYFVQLLQTASLPYYEESLARVGMLHTHSPSGIFIVGVGGLVLIGYGILWWSRLMPFNQLSLVLSMAVLGAMIAVNQHIVTGLNLEFTSHYHLVAMYADFFAVAYGISTLLSRVHARRALFERGIVAAALIFSLSNLIHVTQVEVEVTPEFITNQRYASTLAWLDLHTKVDDVVYADDALSYLIPAYTHDNVFYRPEAGLYIMPQSEFEKRFLLHHYFDTTLSRVDFDRKEIERQVFGNFYLERAAHLRSLNTLRRLAGLAELSVERYPEDRIQVLLAQWAQVKKEPLDVALFGYRVDYIVWDTAKSPGWQLDSIASLREVHTEGDFKIYTFAPLESR